MMSQYPYDGNVRSRPSVTGDPMAPGMPHNPSQQRAPAIENQDYYSDFIAVAPGRQLNSNIMGSSDKRDMPPPLPRPPFGSLNAYTPQRLRPPLPRQFQQQINHPQAVAMGQQTQQFQQQFQQQHARQALMAQHASQANMQKVNGVQRGMQPKQRSPQQPQQLTQSGRHGPPQHLQAQSIMDQQQGSQLQEFLQMQMQGNQSQIFPQEAEAQNVSHGAKKQDYVNQNNTHRWMTESASGSPRYTPSRVYSFVPIETSERSSNILEPTGKNRSIHATISKDHTAGDDAQSAVSFAKFGQKIQWRACPTFERKET